MTIRQSLIVSPPLLRSEAFIPIMQNRWWKGKKAVVCGASAGLGFEIANQLVAQQAACVFLLARDSSRLEAATNQLRAIAEPATLLSSFPVDLSEIGQVKTACETIRLQLGSVDLIVQAVGKSDRGTIADISEQSLTDVLAANVTTSLFTIQQMGQLLVRPGGTLVLTGSLSSYFAPRFLGSYSMAKHALRALAQQARLEYAEQGVHVMLVCPGPIARSDVGVRYDEDTDKLTLPPSAHQPGGGARLTGLDPKRLAIDVLAAAAVKKPEIVRPRKARLLMILSAISPRLGDRLLRNYSS